MSGKLIQEHITGTDSFTVERQTVKAVRQDGVSQVSSGLGTRKIAVSGWILAGDEDERYRLRAHVGKFLNPKLGVGEVFYTNNDHTYKTKAQVDQIEWGNLVNQKRYQKFTVSFFCPDPYFTDVNETYNPMAEIEGKFKFPIAIRNMIFGSYTSGIKKIVNQGVAETPFRFILYGPSKNPIIKNVTTGEFMRVEYEINADQTIEINTAFGQKRIELIQANGERENISHYLDEDSTYFSLQVGETILGFDSDVGYLNARADVFYNNRYITV